MMIRKPIILIFMLVFLLENLGLIVMRASRISNYRPIFRAPLFPALQIVGIAIYGALIWKLRTASLDNADRWLNRC